jgi:hypothetical protein
MSQLVNQFVPGLLMQSVCCLPLLAHDWIARWLVLNLHRCLLQFCTLFHSHVPCFSSLSHSLFAAVGNGKAIGSNPVFAIRPISTVSHIYTRLEQSKCFAVVHIKKTFTGKHLLSSCDITIFRWFLLADVTIIRWFLLVIHQTGIV